MNTVTNAGKKINKKVVAIALAAVVCVSVPCAAGAAYAYYVNKQLTQSNEISVGQTVETIVIGEGSLSTNQEIYPGDSVDVTYTLSIENTTSSATVTTALTTTEESTNFDEKYFTITYTVGDDTTVYTNDNPCTVTSENDGQNIVVTVKMNDTGDYCYTYHNMPDFNNITLTVTLNEVTATTTTVASFVDDYSTSDLGSWSYGCATDITDWDFTTTSAFTFTAATYDSESEAWTANDGAVTIGENGAINGNLAVKYTFAEIDDNTAVKIALNMELTTSVDVRLAVYDTSGNLVGNLLFVGSADAASYSNTLEYTVSAGYSVYVIFNSATAGTLGITITK